MPHITSETVKQIRSNIKKHFPACKFSVTIDNYSAVRVAIIESPFDFGSSHIRINHRGIEKTWEDKPDIKSFLLKILDLIESTHEQKEVCYDGDYGSVPNYYISMSVGKWDKPYIQTGVRT